MELIRPPSTNVIIASARGMAGMAASSCTPTCATRAARARTKEQAKEQGKEAKQEKEQVKVVSRVRSKCHGTSGLSERTMKMLLIRSFAPQLHVQDSLVARMTQETTGLSTTLTIVLCSVLPIAVL